MVGVDSVGVLGFCPWQVACNLLYRVSSALNMRIRVRRCEGVTYRNDNCRPLFRFVFMPLRGGHTVRVAVDFIRRPTFLCRPPCEQKNTFLKFFGIFIALCFSDSTKGAA